MTQVPLSYPILHEDTGPTMTQVPLSYPILHRDTGPILTQVPQCYPILHEDTQSPPWLRSHNAILYSMRAIRPNYDSGHTMLSYTPRGHSGPTMIQVPQYYPILHGDSAPTMTQVPYNVNLCSMVILKTHYDSGPTMLSYTPWGHSVSTMTQVPYNVTLCSMVILKPHYDSGPI